MCKPCLWFNVNNVKYYYKHLLQEVIVKASLFETYRRNFIHDSWWGQLFRRWLDSDVCGRGVGENNLRRVGYLGHSVLNFDGCHCLRDLIWLRSSDLYLKVIQNIYLNWNLNIHINWRNPNLDNLTKIKS